MKTILDRLRGKRETLDAATVVKKIAELIDKLPDGKVKIMVMIMDDEGDLKLGTNLVSHEQAPFVRMFLKGKLKS